MGKKQQMQWTPRGEHLLLQTRTKVITMNSRRYSADGIRGSAQRPDPRPLGGLHQRAIVFGHPPKFIWLRVGNCQTGLITNLLRSRYQVIRQFIESETQSLLVLERPET